MSRDPKIAFKRTGNALHLALGHREHQLDQFPMLSGTWVDVVFGLSTLGAANHGLGRRYVGGASLMITGNYTYDSPLVVSPEFAETLQYDPAEQVLLVRGTSAADFQCRLWVF
jgi:hypothetical protein